MDFYHFFVQYLALFPKTLSVYWFFSNHRSYTLEETKLFFFWSFGFYFYMSSRFIRKMSSVYLYLFIQVEIICSPIIGHFDVLYGKMFIVWSFLIFGQVWFVTFTVITLESGWGPFATLLVKPFVTRNGRWGGDPYMELENICK